MLVPRVLERSFIKLTGIRMAQIIPRNHALKVAHGISGSSVFETAERTSGYGESSSSTRALGSKLGSSTKSTASASYDGIISTTPGQGGDVYTDFLD